MIDSVKNLLDNQPIDGGHEGPDGGAQGRVGGEPSYSV